MDGYPRLMKGLEMCAGPECSNECPYYGETGGGRTCRSWLLHDASAAIINEQGKAEAALQDRDAVEAENDSLRERCKEKDKLLADLHTRCQVQQNEINALVLRLGKAEGQKPEPVLLEAVEGATSLIGEASYWHGYADALKWYIHDRFSGYAASFFQPDMHGELEPEDEGHV